MIFSYIIFFSIHRRTDNLAKHSFSYHLSSSLSCIIYIYIYISTKKKERRSMAAGGYLLLFLLLLEDNKLPKFPIIQLFILSHLVFFSLPSLDSFILYFRYLMYVCNVYIDSFGLANRHRPLDKMNSVHSCVSVRPKG